MKKELAAIIATLRRAFIDRPVPEGLPREDVFDAADEFLDLLCDRLRPVADAFNDLSDGWNADFAALSTAVTELVDGYHELWRRPFPAGLEMGQILLAAVFERPMRDYLGALEGVLATLNNDEADGVERLELTLELRADEELGRLQEWLEQTALVQRRELVRSRGFGLGALAVSFGLGWLMGDCD